MRASSAAARVLILAAVALVALNSARAQQPVTQSEGIVVTARPLASPTPGYRAKLEHIMPEVSGTQVTVTKKATTIKLDKQPPIENNNLQEQFVKAPGLIVSEQQNPGQYNFSYRGLGNPQESEYTLFLQDGIPLMADWIGFPTLYYVPVPQSVSEIQVIRGGSSLLYGPEPAPAVNYVTKRPAPGSPWGAYVEQTGGPDNTYSSYASVGEASGPVEFRMDGFYRTSDTQRDLTNTTSGRPMATLAGGPIPTSSSPSTSTPAVSTAKIPAGSIIGSGNSIPTAPSPLTITTGSIATPASSVTNCNSAKTGSSRPKAGSPTRTSIPAARPISAAVNAPNPFGTTFPANTTIGYEEFNNGGVDLRARKRWGGDGMFRGSALTFGGVVYHGDAPFQRYTLTNANTGPGYLYAPRGTTSATVALDQDRTADYQSIFIEDLIRIGKFHIVPSFRLDHESVDVDATAAPYLGRGLPNDRDADKLIPLWGIGLGNDFAGNNETYFSASSGWRPVRFFDVAGTRNAVLPGQEPDPFRSLDIELGVHGTPIKGFWYDVGLFWLEFDNRTETRAVPGANPGDNFLVNTGSTRHRGFEGEVSYDLLASFQHDLAPEPVVDPKDSKAVYSPAPASRPLQLVVFGNLQVLDAEFTDSAQLVPGPAPQRTFVGNAPAYAPDIVLKGGVTFKRDKCFNVTFSGVYISDQFWQDSNQAGPFTANTLAIPAKIPSYEVFNLSGEFYLTKNVRLIGGISNLADKKYYSRVFPFAGGSIDPAPGRSGYAGLSVEF